MSENFHKTTLMSLKSRIMLYTVLPVLVIIIIAGGFMTFSVRNVIDSISRSEAAGSTELACSRVNYLISALGETAELKAGNEDIERFLQTADDRDTIEDNAYFSLVMGELDSAVSDAPESLERTWLVSAVNQGVAFSNSSDGWTARPDFEFSAFPFSDMMNGNQEYFITDLYVSPISDKTVISVVAPVRDHRTGSVIGYFGADIKLGGLWVSISELPESKNNEIYIIASDNIIIYHSDVNLIYRKFSKLGIEQRDINSYIDTEKDRELVGSALKPASCGWTIYALRDFSSARQLIDHQTMITVVTFLAVAAMLITTLSIVSNKVVRPLQEYTKKINSIHLLGDNAGDEDVLQPEGCRELEHFAVGFNSLLRRNHEMMSQLREMNIKSEKERKLYQTALQSSSDVVFEYDIETDCLITYGSVFDPDAPKTVANSHNAFLKRILSCDGFRAQDTDITTRFFSGETACGAVVSRIDTRDNVNWIEFSGTAIYADSKPVKIVGKISNINDVVNLREDASRDRFTGLYNKTTTEALIAERLANGGTHAMIIIDVDNFKNVNDILGHAWGDSVIKDIATKIEAVLNCDDIAGRIGGDEFMAFISGDDVPERINNICTDLCNSIRYTYSDDSPGKAVSVSSSIGVALAPEYGRDFQELYSSADIAMYISKNGGKDRFTVYSGQERREYKGNRAE